MWNKYEMRKFVIFLTLLWGYCFTMTTSVEVHMNYMQYRRSLCKTFDKIQKDFPVVHQQQKTFLSEAKEILDSKKSTIDYFEGSYVQDRTYFQEKTSQTFTSLFGPRTKSALVGELYSKLNDDYLKWESTFKDELNSVELCYEKLKDQVQLWKDTKEQVVKDTLMNENAEPIFELIKSTLAPDADCFLYASGKTLIQSNNDANRFIGDASKNFPIYANLSRESSVSLSCSSNPMGHLMELQQEETKYLSEIGAKVGTLAKTYYTNLIEKTQNLIKKYDPTEIQQILNSQQANIQSIKPINAPTSSQTPSSNSSSISFDESQIAEINRHLSILKNIHLNVDGFISKETTDQILNHIDRLGSLSTRYDDILVEKQYVEKSRELLANRINTFVKNSTKIIDYFEIVKNILTSKVNILNEIIAKPITFSNLKEVTELDANMHRDIEIFDDEIEAKYKNKIAYQIAENKSINEKQTEFTGKLSQVVMDIGYFTDNYKSAIPKIQHSIDNDIPKAIRTTNLIYLKKQMLTIDPTKIVETTTLTLTDARPPSAEEVTELDEKIGQLDKIQTTLDDLILQANKNNKNTLYANFDENIDKSIVKNAEKIEEKFSSKLIKSMASKSSELIKSRYLTLSSGLKRTMGFLTSTKLNIGKNKIEMKTLTDRLQQITNSATTIGAEHEKLASIKNEMETRAEIFPKEFIEFVNGQIKDIDIVDLKKPEQLLIDATNLVYKMSDLKANIYENLKNVDSIKNVVEEQHIDDGNSFQKFVTDQINDIKSKNKNLNESVHGAQQMIISVDHLMKETAAKQKLIRSIANKMDELLKQTTSTHLTMHENHSGNVTHAKQHSEMAYNVAKNFYSNKYEIVLDDRFEDKFNKLFEQYDKLNSELNQLNEQFWSNTLSVNRDLSKYRDQASKAFQEDDQHLDELQSTLIDSVSDLLHGNNLNDYSMAINLCNAAIATYADHTTRHNEYIATLDQLYEKIEKISSTIISTIDTANHDKLISTLGEINNHSSNLMDNFKRELKTKFVEKNRVNLNDVDIQDFFDTLEQKSISIIELNIDNENLKSADDAILNFESFVEEITKEISRYNNLKQKYNLNIDVDVDTIVNNLEPLLNASIQSLNVHKNDISINIKSIEDILKEANDIVKSFKDNKENFVKLNKEIKNQIKLYETIVESVLKLGDKEGLSETELNTIHKKYNHDKQEIFKDIKSKSINLKKLYTTIKNAQSTFMQLGSKLKSTNAIVVELEESTTGYLKSVRAKINKIEQYFTNVSPSLKKIQKITPSLKNLEGELVSFQTTYSNQIISLADNINGIISNATKLLTDANNDILSSKINFETKIDNLNQLYGLSLDQSITMSMSNSMSITMEFKQLLKSKMNVLELIENHCSKYIESNKNEKEKFNKHIENLVGLSSTNIEQLSRQISENKSHLICCNGRLHGGECKSKNTDECIAFVNEYSEEKLEKSVEKLIGELDAKLEKEQLSKGDIFGVDQLKVLKEKIPSTNDMLSDIEATFKKYYKQIKVSAMNVLTSQIDTHFNSSKDANLIINELTKNNVNMDEYLNKLKIEVEKYEKLYADSKLSLDKFLSASSLVVESLEETSKNRAIVQSLREEPTLISTVDSCAKIVDNNEKYLNQFKKDIIWLSSKKQQAAEETTVNIENYNSLKNEVIDIRSQFEKFVNDSSLIEKSQIDRRFDEISNNLSFKFNEFKVYSLRVDGIKEIVDELNSQITNEATQAIAKIEILAKNLYDNDKNVQKFSDKLEKLEKSSLSINELIDSFSELKNRTISWLTSLNTNHEETLKQIKSNKQNIDISTADASKTLQINKKKIDKSFKVFFDKHTQLLTQASIAKEEVIKDVDDLFTKSMQFRNQLETKYLTIDKSLTDNRYAGNSHYFDQEKLINENYTHMVRESNSFINQIDLSIENLTNLKFDVALESEDSASKEIISLMEQLEQSVYEPINKFVEDKSKLVFKIQPYQNKIEKHLELVLPQFFDNIKHDISFLDMMVDNLEKSNQSAEENKKRKNDRKNKIKSSIRKSGIIDPKTIISQSTIINKQINRPKFESKNQDSKKLRKKTPNNILGKVIGGSAVVVFIVLVGVGFVIFKQANRARYMFHNHRNVA